jgi:protein ImuB
MRELGYRPCLALAPTGEGAWLLAAAGRWEAVSDLDTLRSALAALPLEALVEEPRARDALGGSGLKCIGDLLRLPRAGLVQRLGPGPLARLERALGQAPDPRSTYCPAARFRGRLTLSGEVLGSQGLVFPARRLLLELNGFLRARDLGTRELRWRLLHDDLPPTGLRLGLLKPERDAERLLDLLRQRLERVELGAPVIGLELRAHRLEACPPGTADMFGAAGAVGEEGHRWLERLQVRLGRERVRGICLVADHRPERAWSHCPPGTTGSPACRPGRPVWLLARPQPLELRDGRPWYQGSLCLEPERERIESGWWDGQEVRRDYFVAHTRQGERLWVYRDLQGERGWFLHGVFAMPGSGPRQ